MLSPFSRLGFEQVVGWRKEDVKAWDIPTFRGWGEEEERVK